MAQTFDSRRLELTDEPVTLAEGVGFGRFNAWFSASANGVLIYRTGGNMPSLQLTWYDRAGKALAAPGEPGFYDGGMTLSPDGARAAVIQDGDIWIVDLARGTKTRLTSDHRAGGAPTWSPDGTQIAYGASHLGVYGIYRRASSGAGGEELLANTTRNPVPNHWSPDGRFIVYYSVDAKTGPDLWILPLTGDRKPFVFLQTEFSELGGRFSPDGRWIAYRSNESGKNEIYVQPFEPAQAGSSPSGAKTIVSEGGSAGMPRWRADGKEFYYLGPDGKVMAVEISASSVFRAGAPKPLFQVPAAFMRSNTPGAGADASPDGKRFLFSLPVQQSASVPFNVVLNWTSLLKK